MVIEWVMVSLRRYLGYGFGGYGLWVIGYGYRMGYGKFEAAFGLLIVDENYNPKTTGHAL